MACQSSITLPNVLKFNTRGIATYFNRRYLAAPDPQERT